MKFMSKITLLLLMCCSICTGNTEFAGKISTYYGASDASAAVLVSEDMFVVADDENNVLEFLCIEPEHPEADIEGATMVGDRIYWITSHGRNKDGKKRANRYRFFATSVTVENNELAIKPIGKPYRMLVHKLLKTTSMCQPELKKATKFDAKGLTTKELKKLAPKREGLNIEGLCASADGRILYIGFRNPRPVNKSTGRAEALVVPLNNATQVVENSEAPIFGEPLLWGLSGLGIRSMEYSDFHKAYFIIAGPHDEESRFVLYRWSGQKDAPPKFVREIQFYKWNFSPEALVTFKDQPELLLLSDDGSLLIDVSSPSDCMEGKLRSDGKCLNKHLTNPKKKYFRGLLLKP
ncbi:MAG: DUF3616 domain-containing protein [Planctomycetota bacterium]|jgi:hypothetical protein